MLDADARVGEEIPQTAIRTGIDKHNSSSICFARKPFMDRALAAASDAPSQQQIMETRSGHLRISLSLFAASLSRLIHFFIT